MTDSQLIQDPEDIRLTEQHQIQAIMGNPPGWLLQWGITIFLMTTFCLLAISWFVRYPDIVPARVTLTTVNPPIRVVAEASGKLHQLLVEEAGEVAKGQLVAVLQNTAREEDVIQLKTFLASLEKLEEPKQFQKVRLPENLSLGSLQKSYSVFSQNFKDYLFFLKQRAPFQKIDALEEQIRQTIRLNQSLRRQQGNLEEELEIAHKNFQRYEKLFRNGAGSEIEMEKAQTNYLQYKRRLEDIGKEIINNNISIEQMQVEIADLKQKRRDGHAEKQLNIREDIRRLSSEIGAWEKSFLVKAPISGTVSLAKIWSEQQFVKAGEEVMTIVPAEGSGKIIGKAILPLKGSGKVKEGMRVNIRLDGYPYQEFGALNGKVHSIADVPNDKTYQLLIELPETLSTTYGRRIDFRQEMQGTGNIITEDRRILTRVFDKIWSILKNK